jgi:hypothetical protein
MHSHLVQLGIREIPLCIAVALHIIPDEAFPTLTPILLYALLIKMLTLTSVPCDLPILFSAATSIFRGPRYLALIIGIAQAPISHCTQP